MLGKTLQRQVMNIHNRTCFVTENKTGQTVTITAFYSGLQEIFKTSDDT